MGRSKIKEVGIGGRELPIPHGAAFEFRSEEEKCRIIKNGTKRERKQLIKDKLHHTEEYRNINHNDSNRCAQNS